MAAVPGYPENYRDLVPVRRTLDTEEIESLEVPPKALPFFDVAPKPAEGVDSLGRPVTGQEWGAMSGSSDSGTNIYMRTGHYGSSELEHYKESGEEDHIPPVGQGSLIFMDSHNFPMVGRNDPASTEQRVAHQAKNARGTEEDREAILKADDIIDPRFHEMFRQSNIPIGDIERLALHNVQFKDMNLFPEKQKKSSGFYTTRHLGLGHTRSRTVVTPLPETTTPPPPMHAVRDETSTFVHETGHAIHHIESDPEFTRGPLHPNPHLEGVAVGYELLHAPDTESMDPSRTIESGYHINFNTWSEPSGTPEATNIIDPAERHLYETTKMHTLSTYGDTGTEPSQEVFQGSDPNQFSGKRHPSAAYTTLRHLTSNPYVRRHYAGSAGRQDERSTITPSRDVEDHPLGKPGWGSFPRKPFDQDNPSALSDKIPAMPIKRPLGQHYAETVLDPLEHDARSLPSDIPRSDDPRGTGHYLIQPALFHEHFIESPDKDMHGPPNPANRMYIPTFEAARSLDDWDQAIDEAIDKVDARGRGEHLSGVAGGAGDMTKRVYVPSGAERALTDRQDAATEKLGKIKANLRTWLV
jgi:hypothetical protein